MSWSPLIPAQSWPDRHLLYNENYAGQLLSPVLRFRTALVARRKRTPDSSCRPSEANN